MACSNRVGTEAPWNIGQLLRLVLLRRSARQLPRVGSEDKDELVVAEMDLDMIEEVRASGSSTATGRPDTYGADGGAAAMSLLIKNGTIVTATDLYTATSSSRGDDLAIGTALDDAGGPRHRRRRESTCCPAASTSTRTSTCRSAARRRPTTSSPGTIAAAHGGTTTIVDFAIQYRGQTLHHAWETWMKKAEGKAAIDYGFHMIITELTDQVEQEMDALVRRA